MTRGFPRPLNGYVLNLPTSTQLLFWLSGRECGKALTRPLKLVMETCSGGQRADWAWQPISCRKPSSGGAKAAGCDSVHLSDGGEAPRWWSKWSPPVSVKIPKHWSTLVRSTTHTLRASSPRLSMRLRQTEIWGRGYTLASGWDYWRPHGLHYLSQHHANRTDWEE